ncbi:MAG: glycosyltransferase [bacterium]|nr:glycosyltransferase [bacterium]
MKQVDIIYFDATSGHRTAAFAIEKALKIQNPTIQVRVLNLVDILESQKVLQMIARMGVDVFNWGVKREKAWFLRQQVGLFQFIQSHIPQFAINAVAKFWQTNPPDAVVSVLPISNWLLERALHVACPTCPYIIIPVDYAENKSRYWFDSRIDAYYINPTPTLHQQCIEVGIEENRAISIKGMPIDPIFYEKPDINKREVLTQLGLNPDYPTVLVGFGGQGSVMVKRCAKKLAQSHKPVNVIFLCGRHAKLYREITSTKTHYPKVVLSYLPEPPVYYYHLADIIIGKPGSMTITESIITAKAILAIKSKSLALVQRDNEAWIRQSGVGEVIHVHELPNAIERVLTSPNIQNHIQREWHEGVFDISNIIWRMAHGHAL